MQFVELAIFDIYLNGHPISETYIGYLGPHPIITTQTGTIVLELQLRSNDSVWVHSRGDYYMYNGLLSTLSIVKVG